MLDRYFRIAVRFLVFAVAALFGAGVAQAGTPNLTFTEGWVGEYSSSINGPDRMFAFDNGTPDLNIRSVTITQNSSTNQFELQGNDIPVTITVNFVNGTRLSAAGAVNWRETASGGVLRGIGLRIDQTIADGYPLTVGKSKTYLLKIPNSTLTIANGGSASGNAALSNVLASLNAQLGTVSNFTMSKTAPASVNQGASIAYTIGLGNSGGGVSGTSVTVQDVMPAGMTYVSASTGTGVSAVSCSQSGQTLTCTATLSSGLAAYSANGAASFRINAIAPSSGTSITNYASVDPNGTASPPSAAGCSSAMCGNATTTLTGTGVVSGHFTRNGGSAISGATVYLLDSNGTQIATTTTNASGVYSFTALTSGSYGVRFPSNGAIKGKAKTASGNASGDRISGITVNVGSTITDADAVQIDPAGVVYDSVTREPVSGAVVKFLFNGSVVNNSWLDQSLGGPNTQTTGADGSYSFVLNSTAQSGTYTISVTAPSGYTFQSAAIPPSSGPYNPGLGGGLVAIQPQSTAPTGSDSTTYYLDFAFTIGANSATTSNGVINNHIPIDPTPVVTLANTTNATEPGTNGTMTVSLSTASATSTTVSYSVAGTATAGSDYTALSGSVTIAAGQTSATISIPVIDDTVMEGNETVIVTLTGVTSGTASLSTTSSAITATNTIADDDAAVVTLANTTNAAEPGTNGTMTVSLSAASATSTTISYSVGGTATAGTDYTALSGSVTIAAGQTSATISIPVIDDTVVEGNETVIVTLTGVTSGTASLSATSSAITAINTIADNDTAVVTLANTTNAAEPGTNGTMTVSLSNASVTDTVVSYSVAGTATAGTDYTALSGSVTIAAGQTSATISIPVIDDTVVEGNETVIVTLTGVTSGTASLSATSSAITVTNTISDNDAAVVTLANTTNSAEPGTNGTMTVSLSNASVTDTVVSYSVGGSATAGSDYTALSGSITIPAGQTSGTISIAVIDDNLIEGGETVVVTLSSITSGTATLSATPASITATNTITDNDGNNAPVFTGQNAGSGTSYSFNYAENSASGATLGTVTASDPDGNTLTFSITGGNASNWYAIDGTSGAITLTAAGAASLANDYEQAPNTQTLTVTVSDGTASTTVQVALNETNVNDTAPVFTNQNAGGGTSYSFDYSENSTTAVTLGQVSATDADGSALTFSITGGDPNGWFAIDASGKITLTTLGAASVANDYEQAPNTQTLTVSVSDGTNTTTVQVALNETNVNDGAPVFTGQNAGSGTSYSFNYAENSASGATLSTVTASDPDGNTLTFSITGGNASNWYAIDGTTGAITLTAAGAASLANDYEQAPNTQTLTVSVSDGTNTTTVQVALNETNVNDGAPVFTGQNAGSGTSYSFNYAENSASGAALGTVTASDPDGNTLTFSITGGNASNWYAIDGTTGAITLTAAGAASLANDYEQAPNTQTLTVTVSDGTANTTVQVALNETNVNDTAPVFTNQNAGGGTSYSFDYAENSTTAVTLGQVSATDADGSALTFSITGGDPNGWFAIDASGKITLTTLGAASVANDYEQSPNSQTLTITVSDGIASATVQVVLNETNVNDTNAAPAFTGATSTGTGGAPAYSFDYAENQASGATVGTVVATDPENNALTFSITGGNSNGWYAINPTTGAITLTAAGAASVANDYEQNPNTQTLTVSVSDGTNTTTIEVKLNETNVDDTPPAITGPSGAAGDPASGISVQEGQTAVVKLTASEGVTWSITGGNEAGKFQIAPDGTITFVAAPDFENPTDGDTNNTYILVVTATDPAGNVSTQTITVTVLNIDDTPPAITGPSNGAGAATSAISINEGLTAITTFTANEPVTWSLDGGADAAKFTINPTTGAITFNTAPDFELPTDSDTNNAYVVRIKATDAAGNVSYQTFTVTVLNIDDTAPLITGPSNGAGAANSALSMNEGLTAITTFTANEAVTWSLDGGADAAKFTINPTTGAITFKAAPDYETPTDSDGNNTYVVRIKATDTAGNVSYQTFTVTILNVDEIARKLGEIGGKLRSALRTYAVHGLSDMLSFNEGLLRNDGSDACGAGGKKPLSGSVQANQNGGSVNLKYAQRLSECQRPHQVMLDAGLTSSRIGGDWNARLFAALRLETKVNQDLTVGAGVIASRASDNLIGFTTSAISDDSVQMNLYARYRLDDNLRTGAFFGLGRTWYDFNLAESDGFNLTGSMTGKRKAFGWMLSGDFDLDGTVITTDAIISRAVENIGNAKLAAQYRGENRSGIAFAVGSVDVTRISVPVTAPIQLSGNEADYGSSTRLLLSPGLLCEDNNVDSSALRCGYQVGAKLVANDGGRNRLYADYRWESVGGARRSLIALGYGYRFGKQNGPELALEATRGGTMFNGQDYRAMLSLKVSR